VPLAGGRLHHRERGLFMLWRPPRTLEEGRPWSRRTIWKGQPCRAFL